MKMTSYSHMGSHIVIFPDISKWCVVDNLGLGMLKNWFSGKTTLEELKIDEEAKEIVDLLTEILHLSSVVGANGQATLVERTLTDRNTVALIAVTKKCNLACQHCYVDACKVPDELNLAEHSIIGNQIKGCLTPNQEVVYSVNLTGGEPFVHPEIDQIIMAYKSAGLQVNMSTNGMLISKSRIAFLKSQDVVLSISLDGSMPDIHDNIRGDGAFLKVVSTIKMLTDAGVKVGINFFAHDNNIHDLESTIRLAYKLGCSGFNPINLVQLGRAPHSKFKRTSEVEIFQRLSRHLRENPTHATMFERSSLFSSLGAALLAGITCVSCGIGNRPCIYITSIGDVYPCPNTQHPSFLLGNLRHQSLRECIRDDHPVYAELRQLHVDNLNPQCSNCDVRKFCGGDCRGETFHVTGDLYAPYVACSDRHDSIVELMGIVSLQTHLFESRANEFLGNIE